jgi:hypothetical protein
MSREDILGKYGFHAPEHGEPFTFCGAMEIVNINKETKCISRMSLRKGKSSTFEAIESEPISPEETVTSLYVSRYA